ncbi:unnamed protein product [Candida verbasci]|uniref:Malate dehydrogenase n=1 Tax=Candida verbasci TaxID=1227364 RepID=A0A9W4TVE6_9ASCO|nr:unnamed protein product [Candida verbasci]
MKVTVAGAAGGIGQPLSLLLKLNPYVSELSLFDIANAKGVAADLSHINTPAKVEGFTPESKDDKQAIINALKGSDLVIIPAGVPRKPGMTRADLFNINASIIRDLVKNIGNTCPNAAILIISNPVNSTVAIAAQVLKKLGVFNPRKLFGVTTLDVVRAETFLGELTNTNPQELKGKISVIGGHSGDTIVPLINNHSIQIPNDYKGFINRVQFGGDEVVKAKNGAGSATLSMAFAGYRFAEYVIDSLRGGPQPKGTPDSSYIYLPGLPGGDKLAEKLGVDFFALPVYLQNGEIKSFIDLDKLNLSKDEEELVKISLKGLKGSIQQGIDFVNASKL